ncbi:MAG TPA: DEAD/DEAH box helicase [Anaerolineales bacterium]|nr:DEAD/DEAH box helicase [Anaerolineales bacterium]
MTEDFITLALRPELTRAVTELGYSEPTPIQSGIIPLMLDGADVIGQAQTGTGKTAAFALPILNKLEPGQKSVQALVMCPTRELALQVSKAFSEYGQFCQMRVLAVYGGQPYGPQITTLKKGVDVVVGTPGRMLDLLERNCLDLSRVRTVVLDEADEMLSMGFIDDIETILSRTPAQRQTALFSATMPAPIRRLADRYMHNPQSVTIQREQVTVAAIQQRCYIVNGKDKLAALTRIFEVEEITSALIFVRTRVSTGELAAALSARGFPAEALSGDLNQDARERTLNRFRSGQIQVLVATDVAARGLDIENISHVFNFDLPDDPELYVHRIGRTGRAGKIGIAISLVTPGEKRLLRQVESFARHAIQRVELPTEDDILVRREERLLSSVKVWLQRGRCKRERELVENLVAAGYDPLEIAAVTLKMARGDEKKRSIAPVSIVTDSRSERSGFLHGGPGRPRGAFRSTGRFEEPGNQSHESGMVRLSLNMGKQHGIRPNDIVGTIAFHADIPGSAIGKIFIQDKHSLVDVPEALVSRVLAKTGDYRIRQQPVNVKLA